MLGYRVPPGPILGALAMSLIAFTLVGVVVARSPYTHANLDPAGYDRTTVALVGEEWLVEGPSLDDPALAQTGDPVRDGGLLFFARGCAGCHGLRGEGSAVGPELRDLSRSGFKKDVRKGPELMPRFPEATLSEEELASIFAFLEWAAEHEAPEGSDVEPPGENESKGD